MAENAGLRPYAFVLAATDLKSSVSYFVDVLGFQPEWRDGENWQALTRDGVRMMIGHCPDALSPADLGDHSYFAYLLVDDVDILHAEFVDRGAIISSTKIGGASLTEIGISRKDCPEISRRAR